MYPGQTNKFKSIPSELSACTFIIAFWDQTPPSWVWIFPVLFPVVLLQFMNVKWYGEVEYWNSAVKIALIIAYIVTALVWAFNGIATASEKGPGLSNFHDGLNFKGGFPGLFAGGYAFYSFGGTEMVALTAGETKKPYKYIPAAAKMTFYRIVILMMLTVFVISLTVNANDPNLLQASDNSDVTGMFDCPIGSFSSAGPRDRRCTNHSFAHHACIQVGRVQSCRPAHQCHFAYRDYICSQCLLLRIFTNANGHGPKPYAPIRVFLDQWMGRTGFGRDLHSR